MIRDDSVYTLTSGANIPGMIDVTEKTATILLKVGNETVQCIMMTIRSITTKSLDVYF